MNRISHIAPWMPWVCSAASGCAWAAVAYVLSHGAFGNGIWAGVIAAPLIGVWAGAASAHFERRSAPIQACLALLSLYGTAVVFGLACGVGVLLSGGTTAGGPPAAVILQCLVLVLLGLTLTGYFIVLWAVAFVNHLFIVRVARWAAAIEARDASAS